MGTWGDGLYDNDSALDFLGDLVTIDGEGRDAARLAAQIGLVAWLDPSGLGDGEAAQARVDELAEEVAGLPADTRAALERLLDDVEAATETGARTAEVEAAIGGYSDGPRIDELLRFPGAQAAVDEVGERAAEALDRALRGDVSLYEVAGDLAALGVVVELAQAGLWRPTPERVGRWREGFAASDKRTKEERGFWWKYVVRVKRGFDLLVPPPPTPAKAKPVVRARRPANPAPPPAPAGPVERYTHAKFGAGTLLARTGAGEGEALEIRFDDGEVRKILARFVSRA